MKVQKEFVVWMKGLRIQTSIDFCNIVFWRWKILSDYEILYVKNDKDKVTFYKKVGNIEHKETDQEP